MQKLRDVIQTVNLGVRKIKLIAECTACMVLQSRLQPAFMVFVLPT